MNQFQKKPMAPLLALLIFVSACGPKAPDLSGTGKALGKINEAVACALSTAGSAEEVFYLAIDLDSFNRQFLATVKPLNIKSAKEFDNSAPVEAKEYIKSIVDQEFEKLGEPATQSLHSKTFYYKFLTRTLLKVIYDADPKGNWRFSQAEYIETAPKEKTVKMVSLYLSIQRAENLNQETDQRHLNLDHAAVVFCD